MKKPTEPSTVTSITTEKKEENATGETPESAFPNFRKMQQQISIDADAVADADSQNQKK